MGHEIDFLAVGEGERSGDAIFFRYGNLYGDRSEQQVVVVDAGFEESGKALVERLRKYYGTNRADLVISTHPDNDHLSGLRVVLEELEVGQLWMHLPWNHSPAIQNLFTDRRVTAKGLSEKLQRSLQTARDLESIAEEKKVPIVEPFSNTLGFSNVIHVLGPSQEYYEELLPNFRGLLGQQQVSPPPAGSLANLFKSGVEVIKKIAENWGFETLQNPPDDATSPENNSSTILLFQFDEKSYLFTGDAGSPALTRATDFAEFTLGIDLKSCCWHQIPHHGSRRNIGPDLLNRMLGPKLDTPVTGRCAYVSVAKEAEPKHPSKKVVNAYKRRGVEVYATKTINLRHHHDAPPRSDYSSATPLPFYEEVEE